MRIAFINPMGQIPTPNGRIDLCPRTIESFPLAKILREMFPHAEILLGHDKSLKHDLFICLWKPNCPPPYGSDCLNLEGKLIAFNQESCDPLSMVAADGYIGFDKRPEADPDLGRNGVGTLMVRWPLYAMYHLMYMDQYDCGSFLELRRRFQSTKINKIAALLTNGSGYNAPRSHFLGHLVGIGLCDSGGLCYNNMEDRRLVSNKLNFISKYDMTFCLENTSVPHYITEKIYEGFVAGSVPIYWGASNISAHFNPETYVECDLTNKETVQMSVDKIVRVLKDATELKRMQSINPIEGFEAEKYILNGKQIFKDFVTEVMDQNENHRICSI